MTTAVAHAAHGQFGRAFLVQPFGGLIALATATTFWAALHVAATGSRLGRICRRLLRPRMVWVAAAALGGSWLYKLATWG